MKTGSPSAARRCSRRRERKNPKMTVRQPNSRLSAMSRLSVANSPSLDLPTASTFPDDVDLAGGLPSPPLLLLPVPWRRIVRHAKQFRDDRIAVTLLAKSRIGHAIARQEPHRLHEPRIEGLGRPDEIRVGKRIGIGISVHLTCLAAEHAVEIRATHRRTAL